jgi:hypothetical protein
MNRRTVASLLLTTANLLAPMLLLDLRLTGIIDWSWWWIVAPLWLPSSSASSSPAQPCSSASSSLFFGLSAQSRSWSESHRCARYASWPICMLPLQAAG